MPKIRALALLALVLLFTPFAATSVLFFGATPALAQVEIKGNVPYRQDSGLTKAEYFLAKGSYAQAIQESDSVIKRHPQSADAYVYKGYALRKLGDAKGAAASFRKALLVDETHLGANLYVAEDYLAAGDIPRALEQMQVLRSVCGGFDCDELDTLEREIDAAKSGKAPSLKSAPQKSAPAAERGTQVRE